jgi:hypothetical protein
MYICANKKQPLVTAEASSTLERNGGAMVVYLLTKLKI